VELLGGAWALADEWDGFMMGWGAGALSKADVQSIKAAAGQFGRKLSALHVGDLFGGSLPLIGQLAVRFEAVASLMPIMLEGRAKREAAQEKRRTAEAAKAEAEAAMVEAEADLKAAEPAAAAIGASMDCLTTKDLRELKGLKRPPALIQLVAECVSIFLGAPKGKDVLKDVQLLTMLVNFDKDNISEATIARARVVMGKDGFNPEAMRKVSTAAAGMCQWCLAIESYHQIMVVVKPKQAKVVEIQAKVEAEDARAAAAEEEVAQVRQKAQQLQESSGLTASEQQLITKLLDE